MMEQIIDHPNLSFWTLAVIYFQFFFANFQKKQLHASETGKSWKQTKVVKITKKNYFQTFFYMMEQIIDPPT